MFKFPAKEIFGAGFKECTLVLLLDKDGNFESLLPEPLEGLIEGEPQPSEYYGG